MIICDGGTKPTQPPEDSSWRYQTSTWGDYVKNIGTWSQSGLFQWSKPCFWLYGKTLFQVNKDTLAQIATYWKNSGDAALATYTANAATYPYTSIRGGYGAHNGFSLYLHTHKVWQLQHFYTQYTLSLPQTVINGGNFQTAIHEADLPAPAITSATFSSDGTWSITVSNQPALFAAYDYMELYLSAPGQETIPWRTPFQVSPVTSDWAFSNVFDDNGDGLVAGALKPFPKGQSCLIGLRGLPGNVGALPGPTAAEAITVT